MQAAGTEESQSATLDLFYQFKSSLPAILFELLSLGCVRQVSDIRDVLLSCSCDFESDQIVPILV